MKKRTIKLVLAQLVTFSMLFTGSVGVAAAETNNADLLAEGVGEDYGLGPVGFDLDTLVERMGDKVADLTIGVSTTSLGSPWAIDWCNEFTKMSEEYGFEIVMMNGNNNSDPTQQASDLKSLQTQQVDGIVVFCEFPDAVTPVLNELYNQGIPVIDAVAPVEGMNVAGWLNTSQIDKGVAMAQQLAKDFEEDEAHILVTDISSDLPNLRERMDGFLSEIEKYPNLHLVEERRENTPDGFVNVVKESLISNEDINAIFCTFGAGTVYCQNAAEQLGRSDAKIYGVDAEEAALLLLKEGKLSGLQAQWARVNSSLCLFQLLRTINGDEIEQEMWEPDEYALCVATPETAEQYLEWFYPDSN